MYERKKYEVKDKNKRISDIKRRNSTYNKDLARNKGHTGVRGELAKSGDKDKLAKSRGRKSFVEKAVEQGVYEEICDCLTHFVLDNKFYEPVQLEKYLKEQYPKVFGTNEYKYPHAFRDAVIKADKKWAECLKVADMPTKAEIMRNLAKRAYKGLREEIDDKGKIYEVGMSDNDAIKTVRLMHDLEQWEQEAKDKDNDKKKQELELELLRNKNKLLEAQISKLQSDDNESSYMDSFTADLDQLGD